MTAKKRKNLMHMFSCAAVGIALLEISVDTGPLVCTIDPTCRLMTAGEIAMARPIFGDSISYDDVRIFKRPALYNILNESVIATSFHSNIYLSARMGKNRDDYGYALHVPHGDVSKREDTAGIFIHELMHLWQNDNPLRFYWTPFPEYSYTISPEIKFIDYNREQQAEIVRDYFEMRRSFALSVTLSSFNDEWLKTECSKLAQYEEKMQKNLPVKPDRLCQPDLH